VTNCRDNGRVREAPIDPGTGLTSFRRFTLWSLTGTTVFFFVFILGAWVIDADVPIPARALGAVAIIVSVVASTVLLTRRLARTPGTEPGRLPVAWLVAGSASAAVLGGIILAVRNYGLWSYAPATMVSIAATFMPTRHRRVLIAGAMGSAATIGGVVSFASGDGVLYAVAFPAGLIIFIAWITLGMLWSWDIAERLNNARRQSAELAVKDERLRFAADLHDIQGHHLQVIALKSELAARLAERDPARAAKEMEEVQRLSIDALKDTRAVVQGYRRTTLDDEIANATRVLAAADIDAVMSLEPAAIARTDRLTAAGRHLLGLVVREATTNVLRHSRARHAEVDYRVTNGVVCLRVINDGVVDEPASTGGTGLRTLAERLDEAGGHMTWEQNGDRFVVAASLPVNGSEEPK
jgi:two-component system sensor histidine kinase DesK